VVRFALFDRRRDAFAKLLDARVGRDLCIVVDGKLRETYRIQAGFAALLATRGVSDSRLLETVALLRYGPLPCRLVLDR